MALDKMYGAAFQMKAADDEQKHQMNLLVSKKYLDNSHPMKD